MGTLGEAPAPVIELVLERDAGSPARRPPDRRSRAARRRWAFAACLALVLFVAGEAAPPLPSLLPVDPQPPGIVTGYALVDDQLFVMTGGEETTLSVYHVPDHRLLRSMPATGAWVGAFRLSGDLVLIVTQPFWGRCCQAMAYDRATGQVRWSRPGDPVDIDVEHGLLALAGEASTEVIDMRSGRVLWQGGTSKVLGLSGSDHILLARPDGIAERRDLRTGAVQIAGRIHPPGADLFTQTIVDGQLVVAYRSGDRGNTVAAYDVDTLDLAWVRTGAPVEGMDGCPTVVCLRASGLAAVEARTGKVLWHEGGWYGLEQAGRLLAVTPDLSALRTVGVVDPLSGGISLDLRSWQVHLGDGRAPLLVLTRTSAGRTTVAVADLTALTVEVIGVVRGRVTDCQAGVATLACRASGGELRLWTYRQ